MYNCEQCEFVTDSKMSLGGHRGSHSRKKSLAEMRKKRICKNCKKENIVSLSDQSKFCSYGCFIDFRHSNQWDKNTVFGVNVRLLEKYRENVVKCEICGSQEYVSSNRFSKKKNRLCRDHDHKTGLFRGLICNSCNRKLQWYETQKNNIEKYVKESSNFDNVIKKIMEL